MVGENYCDDAKDNQKVVEHKEGREEMLVTIKVIKWSLQGPIVHRIRVSEEFL